MKPKSVRAITVIDIKDLRMFKLKDNMICILDDSTVTANLMFNSEEEAFEELEVILDAIRDGKSRAIISSLEEIKE